VRDENTHNILVEEPEGMRPHSIIDTYHIQEVYIKIDPKYIGCENLDWINPAQHRVNCWAFVNTEMNLRVPQKLSNFLTS
jgi:hypothetical protein